MRNLSFNGNGKRSFRNLSNEVLDKLFEDMPYSSIVTQQLNKSHLLSRENHLKTNIEILIVLLKKYYTNDFIYFNH